MNNPYIISHVVAVDFFLDPLWGSGEAFDDLYYLERAAMVQVRMSVLRSRRFRI